MSKTRRPKDGYPKPLERKKKPAERKRKAGTWPEEKAASSRQQPGTCVHGNPIGPGSSCENCLAETTKSIDAFNESVARGEHDADGYTPAERKAQARKAKKLAAKNPVEAAADAAPDQVAPRETILGPFDADAAWERLFQKRDAMTKAADRVTRIKLDLKSAQTILGTEIAGYFAMADNFRAQRDRIERGQQPLLAVIFEPYIKSPRCQFEKSDFDPCPICRGGHASLEHDASVWSTAHLTEARTIAKREKDGEADRVKDVAAAVAANEVCPEPRDDAGVVAAMVEGETQANA